MRLSNGGRDDDSSTTDGGNHDEGEPVTSSGEAAEFAVWDLLRSAPAPRRAAAPVASMDMDALSRAVGEHLDALGVQRSDWARVAKVGEEGGEVVGALIKRLEGRAATSDVLDELGDVILAALGAADQLGVAASTLIADRWATVSRRAQPK